MNPSDLLEDPVRPDSSDEAWPTSGPGKGLRLRLPVAAEFSSPSPSSA